MVVRLNRLFWSDGDAGIRRFEQLVDRYASAGLKIESQVRYHPAEGREGDMAGWSDFVARAVRRLAKRPAVVAFSITNEGNLPISPNTSDGAYPGVTGAIVHGVAAARRALNAIKRRDVALGFTVMWRWLPDSDARFWTGLGQKATPAFRQALDYVGVQLYPGLVWPPLPLPGRSAGRETVEGLTLLRDCYMPKAGLGREVDLWVSENGYATNLGRSEGGQVAELDSTVRDLRTWSGTLGITDYRYFNLRDNDSRGLDLFAAVGLLRDDYSRKPAFASFRGLAGLFGTPVKRAPVKKRPAKKRPAKRARS
jgi:hypothetical protein